ncbi:MAG: ABC transporter ATP-binding protein [Gammaproteobacteria bacterium]|nr:ABC transporter ATP-binding protein [Gammaproteobacteria bacterium]
MLKVSSLSVDYGPSRIIHQLDLALVEDEILMLLGPTGCGKTTILQALAGLIPIAEGTISMGQWQASPKCPVPPERRQVGMVFQDFALFPHLTVEQNAAFRLKNPAKAHHWLEIMGMSDFRKVKPGTLSGGQRQRVALARTLAHEPTYVLLDEPLSNLDAALKDSLRWEIRKALKAAAVPAIWVTHDQDEALSIGDKVGILNEGKLEQLAVPEACFCQPNSRFVAQFLGEASFLPGNLDRSCVSTYLGDAPVLPTELDGGEVDVLVRPDDLAVEKMITMDPDCEGQVANSEVNTGKFHPAARMILADSNAEVTEARYEGGTWLYTATLNIGGTVRFRTCHETRLVVGELVRLSLCSKEPLATFDRH